MQPKAVPDSLAGKGETRAWCRLRSRADKRRRDRWRGGPAPLRRKM